jgi:hypothetical protein
MSDADELKAAATTLLALANKATPGPWTRDYNYLVAAVPSGRPGGEVIGQMSPSVHLVSDRQQRANAALVAVMDPLIAAAVAEALVQHADDHSSYDCQWEPCDIVAVARAINGGHT